MHAYIIAGGYGTRVKEYTRRHGCEKHQIPICGRPFNQYMEDWLGRDDIITDWTYCTTPDIGTGGSLKEMIQLSHHHHTGLVLYGDTYCPVDIMDMYKAMLRVDADMMVATRMVSDPDYGLVTLDAVDGYTLEISDVIDSSVQLNYQVDPRTPRMLLSYSRMHDTDLDLYTTNVGMYMIGPRAWDYIHEYPWDGGPLSLENDIMNDLIDLLRTYSYDTTDGPLYDIGTPQRIEDMEVSMACLV